MTYAFRRVKDENRSTTTEVKNKFQNTQIGALEVQQHDGTYALDVNPANLTQHDMRSNQFFTSHFAMAAGVWNDFIDIVPRTPFRIYDRIRNTATGVVNPSTTILNLANGTGTNAAGDVCIITWIHKGSTNDNICEVDLWLRRTVVAALTTSTIRVALCDVTNVANAVTGAFNNLAAGAHDKVPIVLDIENYFTAAVAYGERLVSDIPVGGNGEPVHFDLDYNVNQERDSLIAGHVYALVVYLNRVGADDHTIEIFGTQLAANDAESATYFGAAGWNGIIAADATCLSAYFVLYKAVDAVINQLHVYSPTGNNLGGCEISTCYVENPALNVMDTIATSVGEMWTRALLNRIVLSDQRLHVVIFEGKARVPRYHRLKLIALAPWTGNLSIEINFWCCPCGDPENVKA